MRLIHITDPHLTSLDGVALWSLRGKRWSGYLSWRRRRRFVHRPDVLTRLIEALQAEHATQILVTGDLVQVGLPAEIEVAGRWLESLGPPERVMLVPGNHDVYARDSWPAVASAWQPYLTPSGAVPGNAPRAVFPHLRQLQEGPVEVSLIGLSSAVPSPLFMAWGRLGQAQRGRLDTLLAACRGFRCVLLHHPPLPAMTHPRKGLLDATALSRLLERHGADLVLHGHVHRNVATEGPGGARIYGTASASSHGGRDQAAYRSFDVSPAGDGWRVEMRLVTVDASGARVTASDRWETALRPTASRAAASR